MSPLLTAAYIHAAKDADYLVHLDSWAEWVMHEMPRTEEGGLQHMTYLADHHQQLWDDTLMMSVLPLAKIGLILGRNEYVEEAKRQFLLQLSLGFRRWFDNCLLIIGFLVSNIYKISKQGFGFMVRR
jgi:unsaturated rhamnogalacturonyl hydrolase